MESARERSAWTFGVVRPYPRNIRERVFAFLDEMGFELGEGMVVEPGTPDAEAAAWVEARKLDLLLLPLHSHDDRNGDPVDGLGVAALLGDDFARLGIPILMPVDEFSFHASFPRRFGALREAAPDIARLVIPMPPAQIGDREIRERIFERLI